MSDTIYISFAVQEETSLLLKKKREGEEKERKKKKIVLKPSNSDLHKSLMGSVFL
jgi:hypothetical protein